MAGEHEGGVVKPGRLYVVATPIGNLEDVTLRALRVLGQADVIAAEDTRVTARLLDRHGIIRPLVAVHEHNEVREAARLLDRIERGESVALVTDAGTPGISDPGAQLVRMAHERGVVVEPVPGASALAAGVSVAGLGDAPVLFLGFLPAKGPARRKLLAPLRDAHWNLVLYEAPHRVEECVADIAAELQPERALVFARELTKVYETVHRTTVGEAGAWLRGDDNRRRGEFVLLVEGAPRREEDDEAAAGRSAEIDRVLGALLGELPLAQAVKLACTLTGARRNAVYPRALQLSADAGGAAGDGPGGEGG
jgi:16S rRNA (cytidine1402-2'-O)-methyltransferase